MAERRPPNWDWVSAVHGCTAFSFFGELRGLAKRDVQARNAKLGRETFELREINGLQFSVGKVGADLERYKFFRAEDEGHIAVCGLNRVNEVVYEVALDSTGTCRYRRNDEWLDHWQVLKAALEPLLFG